jgi:hypothetical protein
MVPILKVSYSSIMHGEMRYNSGEVVNEVNSEGSSQAHVLLLLFINAKTIKT